MYFFLTFFLYLTTSGLYTMHFFPETVETTEQKTVKTEVSPATATSQGINYYNLQSGQLSNELFVNSNDKGNHSRSCQKTDFALCEISST